jgi:hypothetical protein
MKRVKKTVTIWRGKNAERQQIISRELISATFELDSPRRGGQRGHFLVRFTADGLTIISKGEDGIIRSTVTVRPNFYY